jgi:acetylornithine deacetylase
VSELLRATLEHLRALVAFDTRNPPRHIGADGIFAYLCGHLPGFELDLVDHGAGAVSLYARRGNPKTCSMCIWTRCRLAALERQIRTSCG